ncbi:MAG TPA: YfhO family protein [Acidimicrobiales bacterium]|nr:YfhO family protein [Acidimicrobiales bacterium]
MTVAACDPGPASTPARAEHPGAGEGVRRWGAWVAVAAVCGWGLWSWRSELTAVPYLDDSSVHAQMVRAAVTRFQGGHLPLTSWWPYLGLGSPQFLHYQALPSMLTGLLGLGIGGDAAFRLSLYLLLSLWPVPVYWSARLFGLGRGAAVLCAAASPFLATAVGVGYEPKAYVWIGYGVWAQLWGAWALPLAWAWTWRAVQHRRALPGAVVFVALTVSMHFETGYLALIAVPFLAALAPGPWRGRAVRAVAVFAGALVASAWVTVPLVVQGKWAATNEILRHTPLENGYGAKQVLAWLLQGQLFDAGRLPVVPVLGAVGIVVCVVRWRGDGPERGVLGLFLMSLVLSFGRTTFGSLSVLLPGSTDIFMRRFMMGIEMAGLYLAGLGGAALAGVAGRLVRALRPELARRLGAEPPWRLVPVAAAGLLGFGVLAPAWLQMGSYAADNAQDISTQHAADGVQGAEVDRLLAVVEAGGGGRVYAGMPSNWGSSFTVGYVPVFKYLESKDIEEVGYTLRTASLMTDPEFYFDESNPGDYALFGVHWMILPVGHAPPVPARLVRTEGPYRLYALPNRGYVRVVDTIGVLSVDRTDVGVMSVPYLESDLAGEGHYLSVAYDGADPAPLSAPDATRLHGAAGEVRAEEDDLPDGRVRATVVAHRRAVVVLSASYDPGWTVTVDGRAAPTVMVAPALPAVVVGPGHHTVVFAYRGFGAYDALFALAVVGMAAVVVLARRRRPGEGD